jgi:hypothetical protein
VRFLMLLLLLSACAPTQRSNDDDDANDDDAVNDDDDASNDDDAVDDDDASGPSGDTHLTFEMEFDVVGGDLDGVLSISFADNAGDLTCRQRLLFDGSVAFGAGLITDCPGCTGVLTIDPESVLDLTNPAVDSEDCDPAWIVSSQLNYGVGMLTPRDQDGFGDLLSIGLIDIERFAGLGLFVDQAQEYDAPALISAFQDGGTAIAQIGYLADEVGSVTNGTGFGAVAEGAGPGGDAWLAAWQIYRNPAVNPYTGLDMEGQYLGRMLWNVNDSW